MPLGGDIPAFSGAVPGDAFALPVVVKAGAQSSGTSSTSGTGKRAPVTANISAANSQIVAAQGAGRRITIYRGTVHNRAAVAQVVSLKDGSGGYIGWRAQIGANQQGSVFEFVSGWDLTPNGGFFADAESSSVDINVTDWGVA